MRSPADMLADLISSSMLLPLPPVLLLPVAPAVTVLWLLAG